MTYTAQDDLRDSYRAARHADELAREDSDRGYATERAMRRAEGARQPVVWADFLRDGQQRAPEPHEVARVWSDYLLASHVDVATAGLAYETATAARDMALWDAVSNGGMSRREVARLLDVNVNAVIRCVLRHEHRDGQHAAPVAGCGMCKADTMGDKA